MCVGVRQIVQSVYITLKFTTEEGGNRAFRQLSIVVDVRTCHAGGALETTARR